MSEYEITKKRQQAGERRKILWRKIKEQQKRQKQQRIWQTFL